jgi:endonuclease I
MKLKAILVSVLLGIGFLSIGQIPANYYDSANGLREEALKMALHNIIDNHTSVSYASLKNTYHEITDKKSNGKVWDMYSDVPGGTPPYEYSFIAADQCGNYSVEGDCYNREHSFPQSWFNSNSPMQSDLFHVYPTDGKVNGYRSSYPFGEVSSPTWTSLNGSKLGPCSAAGYSGTVFEPIDAYKGDFARTYFYMATRYYTEDGSWQTNAMVTKSQLNTWALNLLYQWHLQDPVSQKEIDRNEAVYGIQHNRNPYIDHPEWVDSVWFYVNTASIEAISALYIADIYPNPVQNLLSIRISGPNQLRWTATVYDLQGRAILNADFANSNSTIDVSNLSAGMYVLHLTDQENQIIKTLKWIKE